MMIGAGAVALAILASVVLSGRAAAADFMTRLWPFVVLGVSVALVVLLISVAKMHAFLALILAAMSVGMMSAAGRSAQGVSGNPWVAAVEMVCSTFGTMAGTVGLIIALASVIGTMLAESGAADSIVQRFLGAFGPRHAGLALLLATYVVSIPIFFETIFMLLVPLARRCAATPGATTCCTSWRSVARAASRTRWSFRIRARRRPRRRYELTRG